ncbi:MAG: hypothetical protein NWS60_02580 [Ilumatobacteraceae bacterium]|nr:hypothetical protein [Ilumatobacteraceae bacterium]
MASNVCLMSSAPNSAVEPQPVASNSAKPERMLAGFPWVSAIVLYTLSWGWSLLRPNTLYWDDWNDLFQRDKWFAKNYYSSTGRPPWEGVLHGLLNPVGFWTICFLTFILFFASGIFLFAILRKVGSVLSSEVKLITFIFLIVPANHARISLIVFQYTTSYFLFYLGWFVLVRYKSTKSFVLACMILFLSFKTHSFLFFVLLPFLHFGWLNRARLLDLKKLSLVHFQFSVIAVLPVLYVISRSVFWPPSQSWQDYQQPTWAGVLTGLWPVLIGLVGLSIIGVRRLKKLRTPLGLVLLVVGFSITALALFPYFAGELYVGYAGRPAYITVFEFRADWRSRHQLLMPLGLALSVVGLNELLKWRGKNIVVTTVLVISVALNMFWGSQYFLQSHKQEQLVELFKTTKAEVEIASVEDQTLRFNGRESTFRSYEWNGFMTLAGIPTDRPGCEALPSGSALILKSDTSYLQALVTRDLGLYFEIKPCSEVLAQNN